MAPMLKHLFCLIEDTGRSDLTSITHWECGDFDHTIFWEGKRFDGSIPDCVRLYVDTTKPLPSDYLWNLLSWPICSQRFLELLLPFAARDIQIFDAPLFDLRSKAPVRDYKVINPIRLIPCLDLQNSVLAISDEDKELMGVYEYVFRANQIPNDAHIFRPQEWYHAIVLSEELTCNLTGKQLTGIALVKCKTS